MINLVHIHDPSNRAILSDNLPEQLALEIEHFGTPHFRIQKEILRYIRLNHRFVPHFRTSSPSPDLVLSSLTGKLQLRVLTQLSLPYHIDRVSADGNVTLAIIRGLAR